MRQAGSGIAPAVPGTELGFPRPALVQRRRADRPAREKNRRRRVVVAICSPRPISRARLWAITCTASQAPLAAKPGRHVNQRRTPRFSSVLDGRRWSASSSRVSPSRCDEAVQVAKGPVGTGRGLHPPDDDRTGAAPGSAPASRRRRPSSRGPAPVCIGKRRSRLLCWRILHLTTGGDESVGVEAAVPAP